MSKKIERRLRERSYSGEDARRFHEKDLVPLLNQLRGFINELVPSNGELPEVALGAAAGAGAAFTVEGGATAFTLSITSGAGSASGDWAFLTLSIPIDSPRVFLTPGSTDAAGLAIYVLQSGGDTATLTLSVVGTPADATVYTWNILVTQ